MTRRRPFLFLLLAFVLLLPAFTYPDVLGNQPDGIADESYFLTSALQAVQKNTLPGWEFSPSGAYYGGVQTYVDTAVILPVIAGSVVAEHSISRAQVWVALHTGVLMQVLRVTNGLVFLGTIFLLAWYFTKRRIPQPLVLQFLLLLALLLGNSLVVMLAHTTKVWLWYMVIECLAGTLVLAQDYYLTRLGEPFVAKSRYVGFLLWLALLAFFQTFIGVASTGLWLVWAWWLGHYTARDVWAYIKKWWWLAALVASTQISFVWRAFFERATGGLLDPSGGATEGHPIYWMHRIIAPLYNSVLSQPFVLLYCVALVLLCMSWYRRLLGHAKRYLYVGVLHPLIVYATFYLLFGFDSLPRYAVILTMALSFSVVMLVPTRGWYYKAVAFGASALAGAVLVNATFLYWSPSYQAQLLQQLQTQYDDPRNTFVLDPGAVTLQLPLNGASLQRLDAISRGMSRYAYLLEHVGALQNAVSFAPLVLYTHTAPERDADIAQQQSAGARVFLILPTRVGSTAEPDILTVFFAAHTLGTPYVIKQLSP